MSVNTTFFVTSEKLYLLNKAPDPQRRVLLPCLLFLGSFLVASARSCMEMIKLQNF
jgi:hypothetical protein